MCKLYIWLRFMAIMPTQFHSTRSVLLTRRWWSGSWASCTRRRWWGIVRGRFMKVTFHFMPSSWMITRLAGLPHCTSQPVTCVYPVLHHLNNYTNSPTWRSWSSVMVLHMYMISAITHDSVDVRLRLILPRLRCYGLSVTHMHSSRTITQNKECMELI